MAVVKFHEKTTARTCIKSNAGGVWEVFEQLRSQIQDIENNGRDRSTGQGRICLFDETTFLMLSNLKEAHVN